MKLHHWEKGFLTIGTCRLRFEQKAIESHFKCGYYLCANVFAISCCIKYIVLSFVVLQLTRPAQELLMSLALNCNSHSSEDVEVISNLIRMRLKTKPLANHYVNCIKYVVHNYY